MESLEGRSIPKVQPPPTLTSLDKIFLDLTKTNLAHVFQQFHMKPSVKNPSTRAASSNKRIKGQCRSLPLAEGALWLSISRSKSELETVRRGLIQRLMVSLCLD